MQSKPFQEQSFRHQIEYGNYHGNFYIQNITFDTRKIVTQNINYKNGFRLSVTLSWSRLGFWLLAFVFINKKFSKSRQLDFKYLNHMLYGRGMFLDATYAKLVFILFEQLTLYCWMSLSLGLFHWNSCCAHPEGIKQHVLNEKYDDWVAHAYMQRYHTTLFNYPRDLRNLISYVVSDTHTNFLSFVVATIFCYDTNSWTSFIESTIFSV